MKQDFRKLTEWTEETLRIHLAEERKLLEWTLEQEAQLSPDSASEKLNCGDQKP